MEGGSNYTGTNISKSFEMSTYLHVSIYGIYIAPFQGNYSEALAAQVRAKRSVKQTKSGAYVGDNQKGLGD